VTGRGGVPASGVSAVVLNVTATGATAASHLTVFPAGAALPVASNLNFGAQQTVANRVIVGVGTQGEVSVFNAAGSTHLVVDVSGWFTDGTQPQDFLGLQHTGLRPARLLDTRVSVGAIAPNQAVSLLVAGQGGVPPGLSPGAVVLNVTVTEPTAAGFITVFPSGFGRPLASDLNFSPGQTVANLVVVRLGDDGRILLYNSHGFTHLVVDVMGWYG